MASPSFTKTFHNKPYSAISPTRPELSAKGKVVLITGAGSGIGAATAVAFAEADAKAIILCGRRIDPLNQTKADIEGKDLKAEVLVLSLDVVSEESVSQVFDNVSTRIGPVDILISGAGHLSDSSHVKDSTLANFWDSFETQVKGTFLVCKHWLRKHGSHDPTFISMNSLLAHLPAEGVGTAPASYASSKIAQGKLVEWVAKENKDVRCYSVHPGVVQTDMSRRSIQMAEDPAALQTSITWDDVNLSAHFFVWLASSEGAVMPTGKYLWINWDVEELKAKAKEISEDPYSLTLTLAGWPYAQPGTT